MHLTQFLQGGERLYTGKALDQLPAAIQAYEEMQKGDEPVPKGNVVVAYKFIPEKEPVAIVQVFYNVCPRGILSAQRPLISAYCM